MIVPIELRPDDHGIPFANERDDRSLAAEFAQVSGSARASQRVSMAASLKSSNVPDYVPHAGIVPAACIPRYETGRIKQSSFEPIARPAN